MAKVTDISVFYRRQVSPAQYEAEEVRLEGRAEVADGEDWEAVAYDLLARARAQTHRVLGRPEPEIADFAPLAGWLSDPQPNEEAGAVVYFNADEQPKRKRRTKAEMAAARAAEQATPTPADTTAAAAATADADDDVLALLETPVKAPVADISDKDLQAAAQAQAKVSSVEAVKAVMTRYGIARMGELAQDKRPAFLAELKALGK